MNESGILFLALIDKTFNLRFSEENIDKYVASFKEKLDDFMKEEGVSDINSLTSRQMELLYDRIIN